MLHATETWAVTVSTSNRLKLNDVAMIPSKCNVRAYDNVHSDSYFLLHSDLPVKCWTRRA